MSALLNRDRLGKVLALLASPMDGEALAAGRMAVKLLAEAGMRPEALAVEPKATRDTLLLSRLAMAERFNAVMGEHAAQLRERVDVLEAELEAFREPLDWVMLADRLRMPKAMEYRARTGKLDLTDRVFIRRLLAEAERNPMATLRSI